MAIYRRSLRAAVGTEPGLQAVWRFISASCLPGRPESGRQSLALALILPQEEQKPNKQCDSIPLGIDCGFSGKTHKHCHDYMTAP